VRQITTFPFVLTSDYITLLTAREDPPRYRIHLRFFVADASVEQTDYIPDGIEVKVNTNSVRLPSMVQLDLGGSRKRKDLPIDITPVCQLIPDVENLVHISWIPQTNRRICTCIRLLRHYSAVDLLEMLLQRGIRAEHVTRELIKQTIASGADSNIAMTSLCVSLRCPFGKIRIQLPCRAYHCTHEH